MSEIEDAPRTYSGALLAAIAVALLAAIGGLVWCFTLGSRLTTAQAELADAKQQNAEAGCRAARNRRPPAGGHR